MYDMFVYVRKFSNHEVPAVLMGFFNGDWYFGFPMAIDDGTTCALLFPEHLFEGIKERVSQAEQFKYSGFIGTQIAGEGQEYTDELMPLAQWLEIVNKHGKFPT